MRFRGTLSLRQILRQKHKKINSHREKIWAFFSQILSKLCFEWKIEPKDEHNQDIFSKIKGFIYDFQKRTDGGDFPITPTPASFAPVRVAKYASLSLNIPIFP